VIDGFYGSGVTETSVPVEAPAGADPPVDDRGRPAYARGPVGLVALVATVALAVTVNQYGYHRDELYFRMLGAHPAWGYIDEPPMTPMLVRASTWAFGDSLWALRLPAIVSAVAAIALAALLARELGGGRFPQVAAAIGVSGTFLLVAGHVMLTASPDMVFWLLTILFACRALLRDEPRWWLAAGATVGAALYNKQLIVLLLIGLAAGLLISGPRRVLASKWLWAGVALAVVLAAPTLVWQATNGWPEVRMAGAIDAHKGSNDRVTFLPFQLILLGLPLVPIWIAGLAGLWRVPAWRPIRALGWAYPVVSAIVLVTGGQMYYTFGLLALYLAAGCARLPGWINRRPARRGWVVAALAVSALIAIPTALPVIPVRALTPSGIGGLNQAARDQVGWPAYVAEVARAYDQLPADQRARAAVITGNYGEAGAISKFGPGLGLPPTVYSGQNQLYFYGPPPDRYDVAVIVGLDPADFGTAFAACRAVAALDNGVGVDNEEQGRDIVVCTGQTASWATLWPSLQHYD
jgi:hypothetical protein